MKAHGVKQFFSHFLIGVSIDLIGIGDVWQLGHCFDFFVLPIFFAKSQSRRTKKKIQFEPFFS